MIYDERKAFPHPVLSGYSDDYQNADFQSVISLTPDGSSVVLDVGFELSEASIADLISGGKARYGILVKCPRTHYRRLFQTAEKHLLEDIGKGQLRDRIELFPFVIATKAVPDFRSPNFNPEYGERRFDIEPGGVLAVEEPTYRFGDLPPRNFGSIFRILHSEDSTVPPKSGMFDMSLNQDFIHILVKESDKGSIDAALNDPEWREIVVNAVVLPALVQVLSNLAHEHQAFKEYDWYRTCQLRLQELDRDIENIEDSESLLLAQLMLDGPMGRLDFPKL